MKRDLLIVGGTLLTVYVIARAFRTQLETSIAMNVQSNVLHGLAGITEVATFFTDNPVIRQQVYNAISLPVATSVTHSLYLR